MSSEGVPRGFVDELDQQLRDAFDDIGRRRGRLPAMLRVARHALLAALRRGSFAGEERDQSAR